MKRDISNIDDIKLVVDTFYGKVRNDDTIGHIFNKVINVNWEEHLPRMYSFWNTVLFGNISYKGNPVLKHIALDDRVSLTEEHFTQWIALWKMTIHETFQGVKAKEASEKADMMKHLMLSKIKRSRQDKARFIQ